MTIKLIIIFNIWFSKNGVTCFSVRQYSVWMIIKMCRCLWRVNWILISIYRNLYLSINILGPLIIFSMEHWTFHFNKARGLFGTLDAIMKYYYLTFCFSRIFFILLLKMCISKLMFKRFILYRNPVSHCFHLIRANEVFTIQSDEYHCCPRAYKH